MSADAGDGAAALIGRTFHDRYRIERLLGRGGMGAVYLARQINMDRLVALKVLARHLSTDPKQVQRFNQEAMASSRLRHPNTIRVFDHGQTKDGYLFLAMEFLEGLELSRVIRREAPLDPRRVVQIARQIVKSVGEAHELQIIHRDLKPDNVFLCNIYGEKDFVKVLDFGIAKFTEQTAEHASLTNTGFICGTPLYIAPEQALGNEVTARTDLYSLGVMMYEMLTGAPPFKAETPIAIVMKQIHDAPPPLRQLRPDLRVPPDLEALLFRLLAKDPRSRPASAADVAAALDAVLSGGGGAMTGQFRGFEESREEVTLLSSHTIALPDFAKEAVASASAAPTPDDDDDGSHIQTQMMGIMRPPPVPADDDDTESQIPVVPPGPPVAKSSDPDRTIAAPGGILAYTGVAPPAQPPSSAPAPVKAAVPRPATGPVPAPRVPTPAGMPRPVTRPGVDALTGAIPTPGGPGQGSSSVLPIVLAAAVLVLMLGGGAAAWFLLGSGGAEPEAAAAASVDETPVEADEPSVEAEEPDEPDEVAAPEPAKAAPAEVAAAPVEAEEPEAAPEEPASVNITIGSTPEGATVLDGEAELGVTPLELEATIGVERVFVLRLAGHQDGEVTLTPSEDAKAASATLAPVAPAPKAAAKKPKKKPKSSAKPSKPKKKKKKAAPKWEDF